MIGIGLDAIEITRFRWALERYPGILERLFSAKEREDVSFRTDPIPGLAARFAAKEATMEALGVGIGRFAMRDVEVVRADSGAPSIRATGRAHEVATSLGVRSFRVSLTHTASIAQAVVVAE
jgi:holo-[acyl-carrier protein] synthase